MKNTLAVLKNKILLRLTLYLCSDAQNSNFIANKCKYNEESIC